MVLGALVLLAGGVLGGGSREGHRGGAEGLDALLAAAELSGGGIDALLAGEGGRETEERRQLLGGFGGGGLGGGLGWLGGGLGGGLGGLLGGPAVVAGAASPPEYDANGRFVLDLDGRSDEATEQVERGSLS